MNMKPKVIAMAAKTSLSFEWRKKGNEIYVSAGNLAPILRKERLQRAIEMYLKAFETQTNSDELSSAAKNLAMSSWRLGEVLEAKSTGIYYFKQAAKYFSIAYEGGLTAKSPSWLETLVNNTRMFLDDAFLLLQQFNNFKERSKHMYDLAEAVEERNLKAHCYLSLTDITFKAGVTAFADGRSNDCLTLMHECYRPIEEAKRFGADNHLIMSEINVYEEDVFVHKCISESIRARMVGDDLYKTMLMDEDILNIDIAWDIVDWYKQSILLTREKDLELEATSHSRLGVVYDKVLKLKMKAKENFMHCLELTNTMYPRVFTSKAWYQEATQTLSCYQQETVRKEEEAWSAQKNHIILELKEDIRKLEEISDDAVELLRYIYKMYPPKNEDHKLNESLLTGENRNIKKALRESLLHYHPDRLKAKDLGSKWVVLCEEITKYLNRKYETYK